METYYVGFSVDKKNIVGCVRGCVYYNAPIPEDARSYKERLRCAFEDCYKQVVSGNQSWNIVTDNELMAAMNQPVPIAEPINITDKEKDVLAALEEAQELYVALRCPGDWFTSDRCAFIHNINECKAYVAKHVAYRANPEIWAKD